MAEPLKGVDGQKCAATLAGAGVGAVGSDAAAVAVSDSVISASLNDRERMVPALKAGAIAFSTSHTILFAL